MATPVILTLEGTTVLTDPEAQLAYVIRHFASAPQNATVTHVTNAISLTEILSRYGHIKENVIKPTVDALTDVYVRMFGDGNVTVAAETEPDETNPSMYNVVVTAVARRNGNVYRIRKPLVDTAGKLLTFT